VVFEKSILAPRHCSHDAHESQGNQTPNQTPQGHPIHTQNVERTWSNMKGLFKSMLGTRRNFVEEYMAEWLLRRVCDHDATKLFGAMIAEMATQYSV
jgi:hypothetical protein